jgi:hypothetical protein
MLKKLAFLFLIILISVPALPAEEISEQEYRNQLAYRRNKLQLVTKRRLIVVRRSYSYTDIDTTSYTWEAYTYTTSDIATQALSRAEAKEVTDWFIYKGSLRDLSDIEFLALVGDQAKLEHVSNMEDQKARMRNIGNTSIGLGFLTMVGAAAFSGGQTVVTGGAVLMAGGFFMSALNASPRHYIKPDYDQEEIDEYNIALKNELNLPLEFE